MAYDLLKAMQTATVSPASVQRLVLQKMADLNNGTDSLIEPTIPGANYIEMLATLACGSMQYCGVQTRKMFKSAVTEYVDLYRFMSDKDYIGRFSTPSRTLMSLFLDMNTVIAAAVSVGNGSGEKKLTIPAYTIINVADTDFLLPYPIDIIVLPQGGVTVVYDTSVQSPFLQLSSDRVNWSTVLMNNNSLGLILPLNLIQLSVTTQIAHLNAISGFSQNYAYSGAYFYTRAYIQNADQSGWVEIGTTHQEIVYNPDTPTVCLRVLNGTLQVTIPQIYFTNRSIGGEVKFEIFTTKGPVNLNLESYDAGSYKISFGNAAAVESSVFSAPLLSMSGIGVASKEVVNGGSYGLSFDDLKQKVIGRDVTDNSPISELNLPAKGMQNTYEIVLAKSNLTGRDFLATRQLPPPVPSTPNAASTLAAPVSTQGDTITGVDLAMIPFMTRLSQLTSNGQISEINNRVIIPSGTLFFDNAGVLTPMSKTLVDTLKNPALYTPAALVEYINTVDIRYSPFQYIIDTNNNQTTCAAYLMNQPEILTKNFIQTNKTTPLSLGSIATAVGMQPDGSGYLFALMIDPSGFPKDLPAANLGVQLSYPIPGTNSALYFDGVLRGDIDSTTGRPVSGQWVYQFNIQTDFDVDRTGLMTSNGIPSVLPLSALFNVIFYYTAASLPNGYLPTAMDAILSPKELANYDPLASYIAITQEQVGLNLGVNLTYLWTRIRTLANSTAYETYPVDVPAFYPKTVLKTDKTGNPIYVFNTLTKTLDATVLHNLGDPILDPGTGLQTFSHYAGDYVKDTQGNNIPVGGELGVKVDTDLMLMDGSYAFATDPATITYFQDSIRLLAQWIQEDIAPLQDLMYARSRLRFYPKCSIGQVSVLLDSGVQQVISADQYLTVTLTISTEDYKNAQLRNSIELQVPGVIDAVLQKPIISESLIQTALVKAFAGTVTSANVDGLFAGLTLGAAKVVDGSVRPTIGKYLKVTESQTVIMANGVDVVWSQLD